MEAAGPPPPPACVEQSAESEPAVEWCWSSDGDDWPLVTDDDAGEAEPPP